MGPLSRSETGSPRPTDHRCDLDLVDAILGGSVPSWHEFIDRYSGLIFGVIRRQLFNEDEDEVRGVYVDVLDALYRGGLAKYGGRSTLSTWLIVFARNRALDTLRLRYGRTRKPQWFERLDEARQELVRLYFVEKLPLDAVVHQLRQAGLAMSREVVIARLLELSNEIPGKYLRRLGVARVRHEDLEACSSALLQWLQALSVEDANAGHASSPEASLIADEERKLVERLRVAVASLPAADREVLKLRYEQGWTARRIASERGFSSPRKVYTILDRTLARLRGALETGGGGR